MSYQYTITQSLRNTSKNSNMGNPQRTWVSNESVELSESIDGLTPTPVSISYGNVSTPKKILFRLISGSNVKISLDGGSTFPMGLSGDDDIEQLSLNIEDWREITDFTAEGDTAGSLDGEHVVLEDRNGVVWPWFDVDDAGNAPTVTTERLIRVPIVTGDANTVVAAALAAALEADSEFSAVAVGAVVTVTDLHIGTRTDATNGDTGWATGPSVTQQGAAAPDIQVKSDLLAVLDYAVIPN